MRFHHFTSKLPDNLSYFGPAGGEALLWDEGGEDSQSDETVSDSDYEKALKKLFAAATPMNSASTQPPSDTSCYSSCPGGKKKNLL